MWRKLIGVVFMVSGVLQLGRGLWQWNEPPRPPRDYRYVYVKSRQIEDVTLGPMCVLLGITASRRGWKALDR